MAGYGCTPIWHYDLSRGEVHIMVYIRSCARSLGTQCPGADDQRRTTPQIVERRSRKGMYTSISISASERRSRSIIHNQICLTRPFVRFVSSELDLENATKQIRIIHLTLAREGTAIVCLMIIEMRRVRLGGVRTGNAEGKSQPCSRIIEEKEHHQYWTSRSWSSCELELR